MKVSSSVFSRTWASPPLLPSLLSSSSSESPNMRRCSWRVASSSSAAALSETLLYSLFSFSIGAGCTTIAVRAAGAVGVTGAAATATRAAAGAAVTAAVMALAAAAAAAALAAGCRQ